MKSEPLVSVIIPCYNVSAYVEKAIVSILNQTYKNLEIFIVDDASTDDTLLKIKSFDDKRIRVLEFKHNSRKIEAVNTALRASVGDFIAFQDADDWSEPTRIAKQIKKFEEADDLGICFTKYRVINKKISEPTNVSLTDEELKDEFLKYGNRTYTLLAPTMCATMMITKTVLNDTKGYHPFFYGRVAEDVHWVYRILKAYKGATVDEVLYNILIREKSLTYLQLSGVDAKKAYSWCLLSKIIDKDINCSLDLLDPANRDELTEYELIACEDALIQNIQLLNKIKHAYESSTSYRLGKFLLYPFHKLRKLVNKSHKIC